MKLKTPNPKPLPAGFVTVKKGRRPDVLIGVLNGHRQLAQGFDVTGYAPNHFRTIEPGNFGLLVAGRTALEVRALLDGKVIFEGVLEPLTPPQPMMGLDPERMKRLLESPQPHFIDHGTDGSAFMFEAPDASLDVKDVIKRQLHPEFDGPPVGHAIRRAPVLPQAAPALAFDESLPAVQAPAPHLGADLPEGTVHACGREEDHECTCGHDHEHGEAQTEEAAVRVGQSPVQAAVAAIEPFESFGMDYSPDSAVNPDMMGPSQGFLVVGVRVIDPPQFGTSEPAGPPDVFSYVGFQLNPWKLHSAALAHCFNRMVVPSKDDMNEASRAQGFEHEIPASRPVCACCAGKIHH